MIYFISQLFAVSRCYDNKKSHRQHIDVHINFGPTTKHTPMKISLLKILESIFISSAKYLNQKYLLDAEHEPFISGEHLVRGTGEWMLIYGFEFCGHLNYVCLQAVNKLISSISGQRPYVLSTPEIQYLRSQVYQSNILSTLQFVRSISAIENDGCLAANKLWKQTRFALGFIC